MKKIRLILFLLLGIIKLNAQVTFCPPGAQWHYNFKDFFVNYVFNEQIAYAGDSVMGNDTVKVLFHQRFFVSDNNVSGMLVTYIKQVGDTIFMKNSFTQNNWQIFANFNCQIGTGWANPIYRGTSVVNHFFRVDSIDYVNVSGLSLKRLHVNYNHDLNGAWGSGFPITITERLGSNYFLFNYYCQQQVTDDDTFTDYLCYRDNTMGVQQFTQKPCNNVDKVGFEEIASAVNVLEVFPNPSSDFMTIDLNLVNTDGVKIQLSDLSGRVMEDINPSGQSIVIKTSDYPSGIYFLKVVSGSRMLGMKKVMVIK